MPVLPISATLESLERFSIYTPLGIRFWDPARDVAVVDGLEVTAYPPEQPLLFRRAFQTASGVYAFRDLPGLRSLEASNPDLPAGVHPVESSPPSPTRFVINVSDRLGRFLPVTFQVDLPYRGVYPTRPSGSPVNTPLPGFYLFSAPTRPVLSSLAVIRAQLKERVGSDEYHSAGFSVLEVQISGGPSWIGIANRKGNIAIYFPYPPFTTTTEITLPPGQPDPRQQAWDITVQARYRRSADHSESNNRVDDSTNLPDLGAILTQPAVNIWTDQAGPKQPRFTTTLVFGQPLLLKTAGQSDLWIEK